MNDMVKAELERKVVLGAWDEVAKEVYKEEKRKVKSCISWEKKGRWIRIDRNRKLFRKELTKTNEENWSYSNIKDGNGRLAVGEDKVQRIW